MEHSTPQHRPSNTVWTKERMITILLYGSFVCVVRNGFTLSQGECMRVLCHDSNHKTTFQISGQAYGFCYLIWRANHSNHKRIFDCYDFLQSISSMDRSPNSGSELLLLLSFLNLRGFHCSTNSALFQISPLATTTTTK